MPNRFVKFLFLCNTSEILTVHKPLGSLHTHFKGNSLVLFQSEPFVFMGKIQPKHLFDVFKKKTSVYRMLDLPNILGKPPPPWSRWWFQIFYFSPYLGKISNLTNIFQMG